MKPEDAVQLPDKVCQLLACGKQFNRTVIKKGKGTRNLESAWQFLNRRKYCSRECYNQARITPYLDILKRCLYCRETISRSRGKNGKLIGIGVYKKQRFCNRSCWKNFCKNRHWNVLWQRKRKDGEGRYSVKRSQWKLKEAGEVRRMSMQKNAEQLAKQAQELLGLEDKKKLHVDLTTIPRKYALTHNARTAMEVAIYSVYLNRYADERMKENAK